jgi:uncharacterized repeat protein (TIGR03806 family)
MLESPNRNVRARSHLAALSLLVASAACSNEDVTQIFDPRVGAPEPRPAAYLNFPPEVRRAPAPGADDAAHFPQLLSETGAFSDLAQLTAAPGLLPYDLQAPLWSDGASKQRWISLPELGSVRTAQDAPWKVPEGTVLVKQFEMSLDERQPDQHRRLETRLLVAAPGGSFYGVTYRWNAAQTDAELVLEGDTETLSIVGADGVERQQPYYYPGPLDCITCHTSTAGYVLGLRTRQLNHEIDYGHGYPAINQLVAWSSLGFLDRTFSEEDAEAAPRLVNVADETASLEARVRSYWDSNCSMCHAGTAGSVEGWDARSFTPLEDLGLDQPPQMLGPNMPAVLIEPGDPEGSYIYVRSATVERARRMPPIGRNRIDPTYIDVLARWIDSL